MVRSKFLVFALLVLALWLAHLLMLPEAFAPRATDQAVQHARAATHALAARAAARRAEVAGITAAMASSPRLPAVLKGTDRLDELVTLAQESAPPAIRGQLVVGLLATETSAQFAAPRGVAVNRAGLDPSLGKAGLAGLIQDVAGVPHAFSTFTPMADGKPLRLVVGAPLFEAPTLDAARNDAGAAVLSLLKGGALVVTAGDAAVAGRAAKAIAAGKGGVVDRGGAADLYGISLPLRGAPLLVGARQPFDGSPYEVLAVISTRPFAQALANYQRLALGIAVALLLLSLAWLLLIGRGVRPVEADEGAAEAEAPFVPGGSPLFAQARAGTAAPPPAPAPGPFDDAPLGAAVRPPPARAAAAPMPPPPPVASDSPFGAPGSHGGALAEDDGATPPASNIDATRVAMIPQELLDASARSHTPEAPVRPGGRAPSPPAVAQQLNDEEQHFQEVYREFVATRDRCGEGSDGVTYERFVQKLRKNKEQLVQKYACRTVRFQVYVKDGKAALKATPVKG